MSADSVASDARTENAAQWSASLAPRHDLRQIAVQHKVIMYCIAAIIVTSVWQVFAPPALQALFTIATFAIAIASSVVLFRLALAVYSLRIGIVLAILSLVPILGVVILLVVDRKAQRVLRSHGIEVGLLGAKTAQIPPA